MPATNHICLQLEVMKQNIFECEIKSTWKPAESLIHSHYANANILFLFRSRCNRNQHWNSLKSLCSIDHILVWLRGKAWSRFLFHFGRQSRGLISEVNWKGRASDHILRVLVQMAINQAEKKRRFGMRNLLLTSLHLPVWICFKNPKTISNFS